MKGHIVRAQLFTSFSDKKLISVAWAKLEKLNKRLCLRFLYSLAYAEDPDLMESWYGVEVIIQRSVLKLYNNQVLVIFEDNFYNLNF